MKIFTIASVAVILGAAIGYAQQPLPTFEQALFISAFDRTGQITWTNYLCPNQPVYQLLSASSPSGPWESFAFVTNQNTTLLPASTLSAG